MNQWSKLLEELNNKQRDSPLVPVGIWKRPNVIKFMIEKQCGCVNVYNEFNRSFSILLKTIRCNDHK